MSTVSEVAQQRHRAGFACSQSVFSSFAEQLGLPLETAMKIAAPFGGGMARMGHVCGAVTGAMMVIGLKHGNATTADKEAKNCTYALVRTLASEFEKRHGSIYCRELLGMDISTPEGHALAAEKGVFTSICPLLVKDAAELVENL